MMVITETWLDSTVPDIAFQLAGHSVYQTDRTVDSVKNKCGGVCIYVNNAQCTPVDFTRTHCSPDIEYLTLKYRPFQTLTEFTA